MMQLETKYGILKGTSDDFKDLFKDKPSLQLSIDINNKSVSASTPKIKAYKKHKGGRKNKHYSKKEQNMLENMFAAGKSPRQIAKKLKRTAGAIRIRIKEMQKNGRKSP